MNNKGATALIIIGLCGRSGSGKSTVANFWRRIGAFLIDADEVCHYVYSKNFRCVKELCESFGNDVALDGVIVRSMLAKRAYGKIGGIDELNRIAHKYILEEIETRISLAADKDTGVVVIDAPLLFESGLEKRCDAVIAVIADDSTQIERLKKRDAKSEEELVNRLSAQLSAAEIAERCDCIINNCGSLGQLRRKAYVAMFYIQLKLGFLKNRKKGHLYVKKQD